MGFNLLAQRAILAGGTEGGNAEEEEGEEDDGDGGKRGPKGPWCGDVVIELMQKLFGMYPTGNRQSNVVFLGMAK